jgi:peptidoglycan/LPS O-acetylase OafA/YrhL
LAVEEQFYITWPVLVLLLRKRTLVVLLAALVILSLSLRIVGYEQGASLKFMHNFTVCRLDGLAFGSLAAIWLRSRSCSVALWQRWAWRSIAFGLIGSVLTKMVFHRQSTVISYTLVAIGFSGLLGIALISDPANSLLGRMLSAPWLRYVGRISYGLYLLHMPLFQLIGDFAKSRGFTARYPIVGNVFVAAMQFLVALAAASISWRYFESLILRLKAFFPSGSKMHWPSQFPENEASEK